MSEVNVIVGEPDNSLTETPITPQTETQVEGIAAAAETIAAVAEGQMVIAAQQAAMAEMEAAEAIEENEQAVKTLDQKVDEIWTILRTLTQSLALTQEQVTKHSLLLTPPSSIPETEVEAEAAEVIAPMMTDGSETMTEQSQPALVEGNSENPAGESQESQALEVKPVPRQKRVYL